MNWSQFKFPGLFLKKPRFVHVLTDQAVCGSPGDPDELQTFVVPFWSRAVARLALVVGIRAQRS